MRSSYVKTNSSRKYTFLFVVLFIFVFYFWSSIRPALYRAIEPLSIGIINFTNGHIFNTSPFVYFKNKAELARDLDSARKELNEAKDKNSALRQEIDQILTKLSMTSAGRIDSVEALSLGNIDGQLYKTTLLNKGFRDGVEIGSTVYTTNMNIVGKVVEVYNRTCKVELLSKEGAITSGILESTGEVVSLTGVGSGSYVGYISNFNSKSSKYELLKSYYAKNDIENTAAEADVNSTTTVELIADDNSVVLESIESNAATSTRNALSLELDSIASSTRVLFSEDKDLIIGEIADRSVIVDEDKVKITVRGNYDPAHLEEYYISK